MANLLSIFAFSFCFLEWASWEEWTLNDPACGNFTEKRHRWCMRDYYYSSEKKIKSRIPSLCEPLIIPPQGDGQTEQRIMDWMERVNRTDIPCLGM